MGRKTIKQWERAAFLWNKNSQKPLSLREIKLLLASRGLEVSHETIRAAIKKMGQELKQALDNKIDKKYNNKKVAN